MPGITLGDLMVEVVFKDIKNIHLSVYPPDGMVRIAAPSRLDLDTVRVYAISRLGWIRRQQAKLQQQAREPKREYLNRESHYYMGRRYLLKMQEADHAAKVVLNHKTIELLARPQMTALQREQVLQEWYRERLKEMVPPLIALWEERMGAKVNAFTIRRMKTKWGSCNSGAGRILLNLELAKKPPHCLEYVVVHEMVHLLERKHGEPFLARMDALLPMWRACKEELNRIPLSHQKWSWGCAV